MYDDVLADKLPIGVILTDNQYKIKYFNSFVAMKISSEIPLIEQELEKLASKKNGKGESNLTKLCLSINTQIFRVMKMSVKIDNNTEEMGFVFLLFEANEFFRFDNESDETNKLVNRLQSIIDFSYDGIYVTDHDGTTLCVNKSYERITGVKIAEVIGKNIKELELQGMFSPIITPWVLEHKKRITIEQTVKAGKKVIITGNPVFEENGEVQYVITNVRDMTEINQLRAEIDRLKKQEKPAENIVYGSSAMKKIIQTIAMVRDINISILLLGESGVGKEVIAKYIYEISNRRNAPFIVVNCGALVPSLLESELFGYEGGAFTGALKKGKQGLFEMANKGVIFLDEIGDMPLELQGKLLRVLQEGEIQRVGGNEVIPIDVRVICATNKNLAQMVVEGTFREDLYYRLDVITIEIPPLRQRKDDIALLIASYSEEFNRKYGKNKIFTPDAIHILTEYRWPGNVRELRNLVEQLIVLTNEEEIGLIHLPTKVKQSNLSLDIANIEPLRLLLEGVKGNEAEIFVRFIHQAHCPENPLIIIREEDLHEEQTGRAGAGKLAVPMILLTSGQAGILFVENINRWDLSAQIEWLKQLHNIDSSCPNKKIHVIVSLNSSIENVQKDNHLIGGIINCFRIVDMKTIIPASNQTVNQKKIKYYLAEFESKYCTKKKISDKALNILTSYDWSGKEKELRTVLEQIVLEGDEYIDNYHLPPDLIEDLEGKTEMIEVHGLMPLREAVESVERQLMELAIKKNKTTRRAASVLGITQTCFVRKRKKQIEHQSET